MKETRAAEKFHPTHPGLPCPVIWMSCVSSYWDLSLLPGHPGAAPRQGWRTGHLCVPGDPHNGCMETEGTCSQQGRLLPLPSLQTRPQCPSPHGLRAWKGLTSPGAQSVGCLANLWRSPLPENRSQLYACGPQPQVTPWSLTLSIPMRGRSSRNLP